MNPFLECVPDTEKAEVEARRPDWVRTGFKAVLLLAAATYIGVWLLQLPGEHDDFWFPPFGYLAPVLLYAVAIFVFRAARWTDEEFAPRDSALLFVLALLSYLAMAGVFVYEEIAEDGWKFPFGTEFCLVAVLFILPLSFAYGEATPANALRAGNRMRKAGFVSRCLLRANSWLRAWWLLPAGALLVLATWPSLRPSYVNDTWITSISEVTGGIHAIRITKNILGWGVYVVGVIAAAATLILILGQRVRSSFAGGRRMQRVLARTVAFVAIYSAFDLNFGWLGWLASEHHTAHWPLFCLWLASWGLALSGLIARPSCCARLPIHAWLALWVLPALLFDTTMSPLLFGELHLSVLAAWAGGLQLLWWGFAHWEQEAETSGR